MLPSRRCGRNLIIFAAAIPLICAISLYFNWQQDNAVLRKQALAITAHLDSDSARIRAVNDWVYHNKGFDKNDQYFVVSALGPTPIQVMAQGGYCAEKSRLVAAMLDSIGIDAGLVMISPCLYCGFIHTVVEARYEGGRMVVDPTWNVDYPTGDGRFLGVTDLSGTNRGQERVAELRHQRPATDKIQNMPDADAAFEYAVAMNWDKNFITRSVAATLRLMGYRPETLLRPRLLEDPKLFLLAFLLELATAMALGSFLLDPGVKAVTKRPTVSVPHNI
jgi:transglutaminase superfamily protein